MDMDRIGYTWLFVVGLCLFIKFIAWVNELGEDIRESARRKRLDELEERTRAKLLEVLERELTELKERVK